MWELLANLSCATMALGRYVQQTASQFACSPLGNHHIHTRGRDAFPSPPPAPHAHLEANGYTIWHVTSSTCQVRCPSCLIVRSVARPLFRSLATAPEHGIAGIPSRPGDRSKRGPKKRQI